MRTAHAVAIFASVPGAIVLAIDPTTHVSPLFLGFPLAVICLIGSLIIPANYKVAPSKSARLDHVEDAPGSGSQST